ncbi:hypothetical protein NIES2135_64320 (plasmid) [Leptolyngbya boryana NIES-2135]|jgi:hypothetical protein|uniref:Uncharacterized protein n=1 Tax=Leptolyngbya boryana NIES-2135 TaxID=1973484 RepID=A0A1Z4JS18_LEPBY|nr:MULTISPECIES: hypothetical protein [Leptolyngbya]BAY59555.1 hypothetical protein NIES2135_64320 [Leptolyngbya boryana NIES-2135]MBD2371129.1 hypothetical protein [Leptolyngbya sp. FACHB-161]MBD2377597.1 hypothetical protein [Leptolyngbya sp. FACHB-238]MBD2402073.1 hypothetical protein [Leptolyngbya sp. FACHB-239]MBD2408592.1 hypothetical protein [Leptolyngbya sp. FACHB-402]
MSSDSGSIEGNKTPRIDDFGVTVEEYLEGLAKGIDILEVRSLERWGIPSELVMELIEINKRVSNGTAKPEEVVRGLQIMSPPIRRQRINEQDAELIESDSP